MVVEGGDKMKKVVVVVDTGLEERFYGNDLEVIDASISSSGSKLIIKERHKKEAVAVFNVWKYYYCEEDESLDKADE